MDNSGLLQIRLHNQLLATHHFESPHEVISWLGAMQAQSFDLAKWGIGARLQNITVKMVDEALSKGEIVRTHILRPTWHFVSAEDIHWMRELSSQKLHSIYLSYVRESGGDEKLLARAGEKVAQILDDYDDMTKLEIGEHLQNAGFDIDTRALTHVMSRLELDGVVCNGRICSHKHTYALLEKRVPKSKPFVKEEALRNLAYKFFNSHGPATLQDFVWWSGLLISEAKTGLELVKEHFVSETLNGRVFWMKNDIRIPEKKSDSILLLPPFDEFVVSYKERSEIIEDQHRGKVMTKNGLFDPTIMFNGEIVGSWRKIKQKGEYKIDLSFFGKITKKREDLYKEEVERVKRFYRT